MKLASAWSADTCKVRLYFLVKVRKANGRRVGGGSRIGKMVAMGGLNGPVGGNGWTGVPNAGEEEKEERDVVAGMAIVFDRTACCCCFCCRTRRVPLLKWSVPSSARVSSDSDRHRHHLEIWRWRKEMRR